MFRHETGGIDEDSEQIQVLACLQGPCTAATWWHVGCGRLRLLRQISIDQSSLCRNAHRPERAREVMHALRDAKVLNAMSGAEFLLKGPLALPPTLGVATARNLDHGTESMEDLSRGSAEDAERLIRLGLKRSELFVDVCFRQKIWFVLKFFACQDVVTPDVVSCSATISRKRRPRYRGRGMVMEPWLRQFDRIRLQESLPRIRTFWPRFRSWRPARCPSKLQGSGIPVVKLRQDPFAQPSEQVAQRIEFNDLQSLKGPCRGLGISVLSSCSVVDVGAAISMPGGTVLEWTWFASRGIQKFWHSCHHPRVSKQERRQLSIIPDDGFFCARRLPVCHAFVSPYRIKLSVSFAIWTAHVCRYLSWNFSTSAAGEKLFAMERGCHVYDGRRPSLSSPPVSRGVERHVLLHSAFDGRCSNHHRRNFAS